MNENIEKVLAALDGFRMSDEMTYSAYSVLHDEISLLDDLLKAQEPRVMTLEEVQTSEGCMKPVFFEMNSEHNTPDVFSWRTVKHIKPIVGGYIYILDNVGFSSAVHSEYYGKIWRCWSARPTDEQREAKPWQ